MGKLRVFFTIVLVAALLPLNAFGRHKKGDIVQDPNHPNITRECVSDEVEESDRWLVHITGTLPVSGMHNGHPYVDLGLKVKWAACDLNATKPEQNGVRYGWAEVVSKKNSTRDDIYCDYWSTDECDMEDKELSVELMYTTGYGGVKLDSDYRNCQHAIRPVLEQ